VCEGVDEARHEVRRQDEVGVEAADEVGRWFAERAAAGGERRGLARERPRAVVGEPEDPGMGEAGGGDRAATAVPSVDPSSTTTHWSGRRVCAATSVTSAGRCSASSRAGVTNAIVRTPPLIEVSLPGLSGDALGLAFLRTERRFHSSRTAAGIPTSTGTARVLLLSSRRVRRTPANSVLYEMEDALASVAQVEVVCIDDYHASGRLRLAERAQLGARVLTGKRWGATPVVPYPTTVRLTQDYDLLFGVFDSPWDVPLFETLQGWRDHCGRVACFVAEAWPGTFGRRLAYEPLGELDHVFWGNEAAARRFAELVPGPSSYVAPGVDAPLFAPADPDAPRPVDVVNIGRRVPRTHDALVQLAAARHWWYWFDPFAGGEAVEHGQHRRWLARLLHSSRYAIANYARADQPALNGGWRVTGYRFHEGAAAGCVLVGDPPTTPEFAEQFTWPDAVVPMAAETDDVAGVLDDLEADPGRVARVRRAGVHAALTSFDWVYRWGTIFERLGLPETEAMAERRAMLARAADTWAP
jgi:hypothetical protein